jgi:hypothetical protein
LMIDNEKTAVTFLNLPGFVAICLKNRINAIFQYFFGFLLNIVIFAQMTADYPYQTPAAFSKHFEHFDHHAVPVLDIAASTDRNTFQAMPPPIGSVPLNCRDIVVFGQATATMF